MLIPRTNIFAALLLAALVFPFHDACADHAKGLSGTDPNAAPVANYPTLPAPGEKVEIGNGHYVVFDFNKKPKPGMIVMRVDVYTADGKKDTSMEVLADSGMPSMKGVHEMGDQPFSASKSGSYLLPINIVMPGDWEIRLTIKKDGKVVMRGNYQFDVKG